MTQGVDKNEIMKGLFPDGEEPGTDIFKRYTDELAKDYIARHSEVAEGDDTALAGDGRSEEAVPVDNFEEVTADAPLPEAPDVSAIPTVAEEPSSETVAPLLSVKKLADSLGNLRARRLAMTQRTQPAMPSAPKVEEEVAAKADVVEPPIEKVAVSDPDKEAAKGLEKSLPPESEEVAPLEEIVAFDGSGEVVKGSDKLTPKSQFTDTEVVPDNVARVEEALQDGKMSGNDSLAVDALKTKVNPLGDQAENRDRAMAALTPEVPVAPEAPTAPAVEAVIEDTSQEAEVTEESGDDPKIKFETSKNSSPILEAAAAHVEDGTSGEVKPSMDLMMPQVGLAKPEKPVTPPDTVNITDGAVEESADQLVSEFGGVAEADASVAEPEAAESSEIIDPNPLIPKETEQGITEAPAANADQTSIIERLIHDGVPLEGQGTTASPTVEAKTPEKPVSEPVVVPTTPEIAATVSSSANPEAAAPALEHLVGDQQPSSELKAAAPVQQPASASETADPAGIWSADTKQVSTAAPQEKKPSWLSKINPFSRKDDTHAAPKISALSHGATAGDVEALFSAHQAQSKEKLPEVA